MTRTLPILLAVAALAGAALLTAPVARSADDGDLLVVKVDSELSMREFYLDMGLSLDAEATAARQEELQNECFTKGSRRFGRVPRPIRFVGLFFDPDQPAGERYTVCMAIRPHTDDMAEEMCQLLGRPLHENRFYEMALVCGPREVKAEP